MAVAVPKHSITVRDGGLGLVTPNTGASFKVGTSTLGTNGTFYSYAGTDVQKVFDDLGDGPLPHAIAKHLLRSEGKPVIGYKSAAANAGTSSAVSRSGGTSGPLITLSGAPVDYHDAKVEILTGGAVGTAVFRYSLDGGDTWSDPIATAATYLLPSGVTVTFPVGTYVVGEAYSWVDTAPSMSSTNVGDAMDAIIASAFDGEFVHILGQAANSAGALTIATLLGTKVQSAWAAKKFLYAVMEAPAEDPATIASTFAGFADKGVVICGGFAEIVNDKNSRIEKRSSARVIAPRIARQPLSIHLMRDVADSAPDPLPDVRALVPAGAAASTGYIDSETNPALNTARMCTLRTITGEAGFYPTNGITMAASGSDFEQLHYLRVILRAARVFYTFGVKNLGRKVRKDKVTGLIDEKFARSIQNAGARAIKAALADDIEDARVLVNRTDNLTADPTLRAKLRVVVGPHILEFSSEVGLADTLQAAA